jgi:hypothetical protein
MRERLSHGGHDALREPEYRATVTRLGLTIVQWDPRLMAASDPCSAVLRACARAGVSLADLTVIRDVGLPLDVIVSFLCGGQRAHARESLVCWARLLGYGRVWFPDGIVDVTKTRLLAGGVAQTRCTTCRTRWEESAPEFWLLVRSWGIFPTACRLCGADLPQWQVLDAVNESRKVREKDAPRGA